MHQCHCKYAGVSQKGNTLANTAQCKEAKRYKLDVNALSGSC